MATTSPDNIWSPDAGDDYALTTDLAGMASSVQTALYKRSWYYIGTDAQRLALAAPDLRNGIIWEDISTGDMWQRKGSAWIAKETVRNLGRISPVTTGTQTGITTTRTKVNGTDISMTLSGSTLLRFYGNVVTYSGSVADVIVLSLWDGSTNIFETVVPANSSTQTPNTSRNHTLLTEAVVGAGSHTFNLQIARVVGTGSVTISPTAKSPTSFSIDRIG